MTVEINAFFEKYQGKWTSWRRQFHRSPEVGFCEYETSYRIAVYLESLGFEVFLGEDVMDRTERLGVPSTAALLAAEERAHEAGVPQNVLEKMAGGMTGVVARLKTNRPGSTYAYRFDIDALPIQETDDVLHTPNKERFRSELSGAMHACGHDGHATIGLAVALFLAEHQEGLAGEYRLIFQPAEEGARGAKAVVAKGWCDGVDYFMSGHIGIHDLQVGDIVACTTNFLATTKIDVTYSGVSAHAGLAPNEGRNALLAAAHAVTALHGLPPHQEGATRLNVGTLQAGSGRNIIADAAFLQMETRGVSQKTNTYMRERAIQTIKGMADAHGVDVELSIVGEGREGSCDSCFIEWVSQAVQSSPFRQNVIDSMEIGASEDVTYMIERVQAHGGKATYLLFGTPLAKGHHHPAFDWNEGVIPVAVDTLIRTTLHLQNK